MIDYEVIGIVPFQYSDERLVIALAKGGALGVLDPGSNPLSVDQALLALTKCSKQRIGILGRECIDSSVVPADTIIILPGPNYSLNDWSPRTVLAQVTSVDEAMKAQAAGVAGLIAKGNESGGRIGADSAFILFQQLLALTTLPIWVQGGIGPQTAAACVAGGARGVVIDSQLALARESRLPDEIKQVVVAMDGSETIIIGGHRVYQRPDLKETLLVDENTVDRQLGAWNLREYLLPCGQDTALAAGLANRFVTAGGIVTGLREAIRKSVSIAKQIKPLSPGSALAVNHGITFPVLQGPMTRVSDTAEFAEAVAQAGGLPFVALALLRGEDLRNLLTKSKKLLGERNWGVGILGFVDPALRAEQLAVIEEIKPPMALIAGGRPSQARALEEKGITTYLHVPSPGLLKLFLADGARRFIFEGRECGGHVGPRSSFTLWEQQLEVLARFERPEELYIVFAGGIHDARSAAMVSVMAAPLSARGVNVGILMGTAYLFTHEVVTSGAILPAYQQAAIDCKRTVLLETGPGHASRCVETEFVRTFVAERERLQVEGASQETVWRHLEELNLGRLRIASKGLKRDGGRLVSLGEDEQLREGMYMIGDVAMLDDQVISMAELHRRVTAGATEYLASLTDTSASRADPVPLDIAIIGMAAVFPGAADLESFWSNIVQGINAVSEVDPERWNPEFYYDPASMNGDKTPTKWGGFIGDVIFNPLDYGIPPQSLTAVDPTQLISLEMARRALDDAGYWTREFDRSRVSVVFGAESGADISAAYGFRSLYPQLLGPLPPVLDEHLPRLREDSFPGVLANVIAGRIANRLDLGGANFTVDAACASSLAALDNAIKELVIGSSDMVLCGGADLHNGINDYLLFSGVHALSRANRCRTFDSEADGTVLGEGIGCVVLKRLADAERDGDRIYAVIRAIASSSDGRSLGLTAPRKEGQMRALQRAYSKAALSPSQIGLVEAHGTGTVVGDRTELSSLTDTFLVAGASIGGCVIGSVKSQIGHTKCAAGMAGLIKVAKSLYHRVLPPTINVNKPNPAYDPDTSPFTISDRSRPWVQNDRHAAVNAFGFGGSNFTTLLSAYESGEDPIRGFYHWPCELFLFRGVDYQAGLNIARNVLAILDAGHPVALRDLAASVAAVEGDKVQFSLVAETIAELRTQIVAILAGQTDVKGLAMAKSLEGKVAFVFPGQGSQRPGMLRELFVVFPHLHRLLETGAPYRDAMLPTTAWTEEQRAKQKLAIMDTRTAQPALGMAGLAMADLLTQAGIHPDMAGGHSYGELVALCLAGVIGEDDLIRLSRERAEAMIDAAGDKTGAMAAIAASAKRVQEFIEGLDGVVIANFNSPDQTVISGDKDALTKAISRCEANGIGARTLQVAAAFHSPLVAGGSVRLREYLSGLELMGPQLAVWSNTSAEPYDTDPDAIRHRLAEHIAKPVRFMEQIESMYSHGARIFVEVGPGRILSGLVGRILGEREHAVISTDSGGDTSIRDFLSALGLLANLGHQVDTRFLFASRDVRQVDLENPAHLAPAATAWKINGWLARPINGQAPSNRLRPSRGPVCSALPPMVNVTLDRDATVMEYLRGLRELAAAQRDVMLGYLGAPAVDRRELRPFETTVPRSAQLHQAPQAESNIPATMATVQRVPIADTLLEIVSDKTGYPKDMLGLDLDLEAELSIDSIKRVEILGALAERLGLDATTGGDRDYIIEQLAAKKTLRAIVDWLESQQTKMSANSLSTVDGAIAQETHKSDINLTQALLSIVSEKTGYPIDMLGMDQDLEAELSIDSIKRVEILGALAGQLGLGEAGDDDRDYVIEQLAARKTLREIVRWIEDRGQSGTTKSNDMPAETMVEPIEATLSSPKLRSYVPRLQEVEYPSGDLVSLVGKHFVVTEPTTPLGKAMISMLYHHGATATGHSPGGDLTDCEGLIYLGAMRPANGTEPAKELFDLVKEAVAGGRSRWIYALTGFGGRFIFHDDAVMDLNGAGIAGLVKSVAREKPELRIRVVDIDPREESEKIAEYVIAELVAEDDLIEVGYVDGKRYRVIPAVISPSADTESELGLDSSSVVMVTGGARGITAKAAIELALRTHCRLILVGRSPLPDHEEDAYSAARDLPSLRRKLIEEGQVKDPKVIESASRRILADRQVRATVDALSAIGVPFEYHSLDVRDSQSFGALIDDIYDRFGHIDAVIHGAGIIEDKLIVDKTRDSFDRVFDTKVVSARTLAAKLRDDVKNIVFFSSISGALGNRGQADYAAAGDVLDKLAWQHVRLNNARVISFDWGPWANTGMVSDELAKEYARRGLGLIPISEGVELMIREMGSDRKEIAQIIVAAAEPSVLAEQFVSK